MEDLITTIRITPQENLGLAKYVAETKLNNEEISYLEFIEIEKLIELYKN